jgi:hypothetical protein
MPLSRDNSGWRFGSNPVGHRGDKSREVGLWEVISALGIDPERIAGYSEGILLVGTLARCLAAVAVPLNGRHPLDSPADETRDKVGGGGRSRNIQQY